MVNGVGQYFFVGIVVVMDEDVGVGGCYQLGFGQQFVDLLVVVDDVGVLGFVWCFLGGCGQVQGLCYFVQQYMVIKGFGEIGEGFLCGGFDGIGNGVMGGEQDYW